eukprot:750220-Pyramimonas_sp.AAC.1
MLIVPLSLRWCQPECRLGLDTDIKPLIIPSPLVSPPFYSTGGVPLVPHQQPSADPPLMLMISGVPLVPHQQPSADPRLMLITSGVPLVPHQQPSADPRPLARARGRIPLRVRAADVLDDRAAAGRFQTLRHVPRAAHGAR